MCLDWTNPTSVNEKSPICLFLPGLTGDSQSEYIKSFVNIGRRNLGARCVVFNFRGRGGHVLKTPRTYVSPNNNKSLCVIFTILVSFSRDKCTVCLKG